MFILNMLEYSEPESLRDVAWKVRVSSPGVKQVDGEHPAECWKNLSLLNKIKLNSGRYNNISLSEA